MARAAGVLAAGLEDDEKRDDHREQDAEDDRTDPRALYRCFRSSDSCSRPKEPSLNATDTSRGVPLSIASVLDATEGSEPRRRDHHDSLPLDARNWT